jgi:hypothetical protein
MLFLCVPAFRRLELCLFQLRCQHYSTTQPTGGWTLSLTPTTPACIQPSSHGVLILVSTEFFVCFFFFIIIFLLLLVSLILQLSVKQLRDVFVLNVCIHFNARWLYHGLRSFFSCQKHQLQLLLFCTFLKTFIGVAVR